MIQHATSLDKIVLLSMSSCYAPMPVLLNRNATQFDRRELGLQLSQGNNGTLRLVWFASKVEKVPGHPPGPADRLRYVTASIERARSRHKQKALPDCHIHRRPLALAV